MREGQPIQDGANLPATSTIGCLLGLLGTGKYLTSDTFRIEIMKVTELVRANACSNR